jgi:hypothetical protein
MLANIARGPGWARENRHETRHYRVRSDLPEAAVRAYGEQMEIAYTVYERLLPPPPGPAEGRVDVLIFNTPEGYFGYTEYAAGDRLEDSAGVFLPWYGQMMFFEGEDLERTQRVMFHEGFHRYLHRILPDAPIWLEEGMAEYAGATRVSGGRVMGSGLVQSDRLRDLKRALRKGWKPVPFRDIMVENQYAFYSVTPGLKYAQAWSMVDFLLDGGEWRTRRAMGAYLRQLAAGDTPLAAFDATFGKEDLNALESQWLSYVWGLNP